jgi:signal peptidase I
VAGLTPPTNSAAPRPPGAGEANPARRPRPADVSFQVIESIQTVLTALMLAFIFRAFFVEAFVIPSGSMAESLLGQHGTLVCPICGWEFDYGPADSRADQRGGFAAPGTVYCPNCHAGIGLGEEDVAVKAGDRILVHKWPFVVGGPLGPGRWDVVVFRNPSDPTQNYIKRLVGLPNETVEIIDGDVFIKAAGADTFRVARKTPAAQSALWFVVFDQNYLPTDATRRGRPPAWVAEATDTPTAVGWSGMETRVIRHAAHDGAARAILFEPTGSRYYLQDVYGYNHASGGNYAGDVRIVAEVTVEGGTGWLRWELTRDGRLFAVQFWRDGTVTLSAKPADGDEVVLQTARISALDDRRPRVIEFAHLDWRVYVKVNGRELLATTDEQYAPALDQLRASRRMAPLRLRLAAANLSLLLRGLRVDRDVYYACDPARTLRAYAGNPFALGEDEYFVLGDNSPDSADSREWNEAGVHLREALKSGSYRIGTVRADQIVGKAFFVYLPGLLPLDGKSSWRIPDIGRVRFIR